MDTEKSNLHQISWQLPLRRRGQAALLLGSLSGLELACPTTRILAPRRISNAQWRCAVWDSNPRPADLGRPLCR